ncbi:non-ribosomal peptide synthetase/type I polyketide synthase [Amycolatopsis panacis]|uniref:Amino acid adenylation domain-containing protein n=1 Tax=Amycolatopsis panacis TaxID=2340917 RepID=A0A419HX57_9PSEU|nr:non-ribosomal peptide synthetase/type I polyketide synthase [Amycolatopsis panacis]RJQ81627.1 amino acid adenylation domain-containing protein [Amycolatopsis panacis]
MTDAVDSAARDTIAIVGIGCRLPGGASDYRAFWRNLVQGKDCITATPADRYDVATLASGDKDKPGKLVGGRGGYIDGFDEFDPAFFGISPREAEHMDPQQRKLLEVAWEAMEDGGQKPGELAGSDVGVFVGAFTLDYKIVQFADLSFRTLAAHTATGTMMTMVSNRISYCFDFRGPSVSLDTACSSSLVAVHLACQSLQRGETNLALAGGTLLHSAPQYTIAETRGGFLSAEGKSRTFDASADGYVRAEGVGIVALKRLDDALRDGDPVHAVIVGSGVNQDGHTNGITVPNPDAQVRLIEQVCAGAGIRPGALQYIEAHGTSTPVGDPLEANALGKALAVGREPGSRCYVGSVKTNIGHTESAAGIAGLIKTTLALKYRQIPPHINLDQVNPAIDLAALPFDIPTELTAWPEHDGPALAGVNSFGFGGTNAHVLLAEAPPRERPAPESPATAEYHVLPLTTRDPAALAEMAEGIRGELAAAGGTAQAARDIGYTLARRRQHLESRLSIVYSTPESLDERLGEFTRGQAHPHALTGQSGYQRLAWVFTGMGPQWWAMGRRLFESDPVYRSMIELCDQEIGKIAGWSLIKELTAEQAGSQMSETWLAQPANFALQIALAAMWRARGVRPDAIVGHSTGEIAAFYEAGVYTLEDAVKVAIHRSRLQQKLVGTGTMLAVSLSEPEALRRVAPYGDRASVAAINSPTAITLAGDRDALAEIAAELTEQQIFAKFLTVGVPYHSARMEMIKDELLTSLAGLRARPTQVPLYLTARKANAHGTELDAEYWWDNVRHSVYFHAAIDRLADDGHDLFLEIGPHPVLAYSIKECLAAREADGLTVPSIRREEDEPAQMAMSLAALHNRGVAIDWTTQYPAGEQVPLPPYPWKRDRYWVEPEPVAQIRLGRLDHPLLGRRTAGAEPVWEARLDLEALPYLRDHRIEGTVVFPAAGYLEMAAQAVRALTGAVGAGVSLADIELRKALVLPEADTRAVQLSFSSQDGTFGIATVAGEGQEPTLHATGAVRSQQRREFGPALDLDGIQARGVRHLDGPGCYEKLAEMGYHYGPAFQGIDEVWLAPGEALARISPAAALGDGAEGHHVHPALMDSCFQSLLTPLILDEDRTEGIRLPLTIEEIRFEDIGDQPIWAHATFTRKSGSEMTGDIAVYAADGRPLGRVGGFRVGDVEKASMAVGLGTIDGWLAGMTWDELPQLETATVGRNLLILADEQGLGNELAALATEAGGTCHLVRQGSCYRSGLGESSVVPGSAEDLGRLLTDLAAEGTRFDAIVHLWHLDLPTVDEVVVDRFGEYGTVGGYSLIALAQAVLNSKAAGKLYVVTRGTQAVVAEDAVEPLAAPAWGIGRVLWNQELAGNRGKLIDLDPAVTGRHRDDARSLLREIAAEDGEDEIALRGDARFTSRLRQVTELTRPLPPRLRADGSYLVTGAFGALGKLLCRTLVKRGARRLILMGRSRMPERDQWPGLDPDTPLGRNAAFVRELEALGAHPILAPLDITDEPALTAWLAGYRRAGCPPIRGVFHLAGHVRDTLIAEMDRDVYDSVHDPKAIGAYLLHHHLSAEPLDHFVLFASIASLVTTAGQANYAAGNAFLDALAHHRRARGLPALSLDWGPWATGMISELGLIEHYRNSRGMTSLSPDAGMAVLERVLGQDHAQLLIATVVDWPVFLAWYPEPPTLVTELAAAAGSAESAEGGSLLEEFAAVGEERRGELVTGHLTALVADVLRVPAEQVDLAQNLLALGLDSLLAMELRARIHTELKTALPVVTLLGGTPIGDLVAHICDSLATLVSAEGEGTGGNAVEIFEDETAYPLTQNQKALWFLKQLHPDGFAYNIGGAVEVRVELDPELMFEAYRALVERHPSLRATFTHERGRPVQRISAEANADVALFDVQDRDWDEIYRMIIAEYRAPYDLERDPLIRFRLFKRGADRWVIVKAVHHVISDAISTFTFIEELLEIYEGLRQGRRVQLPPVTARYLDFLNWQNRFLASPEADRMLGYWRDHLPAEVPMLALPTDKPRPAVQSHNGASEFFALDTDLSARVHAMAQEHNTTVFVVLMAAYYLLLHRYSGQDDVIVGSPVTGRTQEEFASVYGYFVNPLPLRVDLAGDPTVAELLDQVRTTVLNGLDNQEYPFVLLVDKLGLQHDPSRSAVFQAMFILLHHRVATEKYGYRLDYIELPEEEGQFDLTLSVYEDEAAGRFRCVFKYNTDLFFPETMSRIAGHYTTLLGALTSADATAPAKRTELLTAGERQRILRQWSGAREGVETAVPVHELIGRAAVEHPEAVAVSAPAESGPARRLTYAELDRRSRELAGKLRGLGVGAGSLVGLFLDKTPDLVVAVLAVLRAGGAYLPLDPGYPAERLSYMTGHAGARIVLADRPAPAGLAERVVTLAELAASDVPPADLPSTVDPADPAYVIYTSGSTGEPKAVEVGHHNLATAYQAWRREYRLDTDARVHLQMASFSFDVFTGDLVRALCSGGTLVLIGRELLFNTALLYRTMLDERVDCGEFVPAVVRGLMSYCEREDKRLDFLRLLVVGSDAWKVAEYRRLRALAGEQTRVINSYGLSEATIDSSYFEGTAEDLDPAMMVPIGQPLPGSALYVLDERGEPVPPGVSGELWIGGDGVATGYVDDPELTAQRFVTRSLDGEQVRLYRTGDLARWDSEGAVHLLGRADAQIKVRGHRIEIGEIETRLATWPQLAQAVVTTRIDDGDTVLCAYCVPVPGTELDRHGLRGHLTESLPTFMIPSHFVELAELPLTPNGKVDLAALPTPDGGAGEPAHEPPVTLYEQRMAEHWCGLLGLERAGRQQDFFASGGSSIKLIELIYHLQKEFNVTIPVSALFKVTTLHGMAKTLENSVLGRIGSAEPYLRFNPEGPETVFCFPPAGGHGLVYRQFATHLPERHFVAFNYLVGADKVARYADLVESLQAEGACTVLGYSLGGNLAFEVAKELERRGREVTHVIVMDSYRVPERFVLRKEHWETFERELSEHLRRHTGSEIVATETANQAKEYLEFSSRTPNTGVTTAPVTVVSDQYKVALYGREAGGTWYGSSTTSNSVLRGFGEHAEMFDEDYIGDNANLIRAVLAGDPSRGEPPAPRTPVTARLTSSSEVTAS